jgi:RNA polymerase sigma factor (sigma-70 family)
MTEPQERVGPGTTAQTARATRTPSALSAALGAELIAYRAGDNAAGGRLSRLATPLLWHVARAAGADALAAEDAVQNALLALLRRGSTIDDPRAVLQWLIVTVRREVIKLARKSARVELTDEPDIRVDPDPGPAEKQLVRERDRVLWRAVGHLPPRCRDLLRIVAHADRPDYSVISAALGMPVGSIGPTRGRCLAKLRDLLATDPAWCGA